MMSSTILFCIESGYFEVQTLLAIECLRKFGGEFSKSPILVVTPRLGPTLTSQTLKRLKDLDARYIRRDFKNRYSWYPYTNKALAAMVADEESDTDQVIWLDSDVLVVRPPLELNLGVDEDFSICSVDKNVGSYGPGDPFEPYWSKMARCFGMEADDLPWIRPLADDKPVRFRLHSGVYSFRRGLGLGREFVSAMETMLSSKIVFSERIPYPGDDIALAFAIVKLGLRYRMLPMRCNFEMIPGSKLYQRSEVAQSAVIHYHHALTKEEQTSWLLAELRQERPDVADWLCTKLPIDPRAGGSFRRLMRRMLSELRGRRAAQNQAVAEVMVRA